MKKNLMYPVLFLVIFLMVGLIFGCNAAEEAVDVEPDDANGDIEVFEGDPVVWEAASSWPRGNTSREQFEIFVEAVEEKTGGMLTINVSGPETINGPDQIHMLRDGVVDVVNTVPAYYMEDLPEGAITTYIWGTREQRNEAGYYDLMDEVHRRRFNSTLLDEYPAGTLHVYLKDPIDSIDDLQGKRVRAPSIFMPGVEAHGATTMFMGDADTVDALQSGVLDAAITASITYDSWNYYEVAPYVIYPAISFSDSFVLANVDSVNALPEQLREALYDAVKEAAPKADAYVAEELNNIYDSIEEKGMKEIVFTGEEAERYRNAFYEAYIEGVLKPAVDEDMVNRIVAIYEQLNYPPEGFFKDAWQTVQ